MGSEVAARDASYRLLPPSLCDLILLMSPLLCDLIRLMSPLLCDPRWRRAMPPTASYRLAYVISSD
jgi:hypothetical protein